jgi:hypothetical protein
MTTAPYAPLAHRPVGFAAAPLIPAPRPAIAQPSAVHVAAPGIPAPGPELPAYAQAQPFLTFPPRPPLAPAQQQPVAAERVHARGAVLAVRVSGLVLTTLCALWPVWFAVMALAFGLGLNSVVGMVIGAVIGTVAVGWPVCFWFATSSARRVWPVLVALVPSFVVAGATVWLLLGR